MPPRLPASTTRSAPAREAVGCLLAFTLAGVAASAAAQPNGGDPEATTWSLGIGAMSKQQPYTDIDRDNTLLPMLRFENKYVSVFGPTLGIKLPGLDLGRSQRLEFSLVAKYDGSGYDADDADILDGMAERKGGFWAGAKAEWKSDWVDVSAQWLGDVSSHSKGRSFELGVERTWHAGERLMLTPRVVATWHDKKYIDYYYGVRSDEARAGRAAYVGKSGVTSEVGVRGLYLFDQRHSLFMDASVSRLPGSVKDSPLVDRSTENRVMLGYLYRFR